MNFIKELLQYKNSVKNTLLSQANEPQNRDLRSLTCSGHESVGLLKKMILEGSFLQIQSLNFWHDEGAANILILILFKISLNSVFYT